MNLYYNKGPVQHGSPRKANLTRQGAQRLVRFVE
jgi:hypothetical protein